MTLPRVIASRRVNNPRRRTLAGDERLFQYVASIAPMAPKHGMSINPGWVRVQSTMASPDMSHPTRAVERIWTERTP